MEGGGEVRRVNIIYFLSRSGRTEHPHLIRLHHVACNGIYLRDIKRWLAEVRGNEMPGAFSWSYKRRYKNGYVWQDLLDDDLITPVSDNEYVLKGSQYGDVGHQEKTDEAVNDEEEKEIADQSAGTALAIYNGSDSDSSTLTDHSTKTKQNTNQQNNQSSSSSKWTNVDNKTKDGNHNIKDKYTTDASTFSYIMSPKSSQPVAPKSKASSMLRNLIRCGAIDTNDAVLVAVNQGRDGKSIVNRGRDTQRVGGSCRVFGTPWNSHQHQNQHQQQEYYNARRSFDGGRSSSKRHDLGTTKPTSAVYKPSGGPTCLQCGKSFKPEKLHAHMKACKGMKALAKSGSISRGKTPSHTTSNPSQQEAVSTYFLTN